MHDPSDPGSEHPLIILLGGPNGAGKSTTASRLLPLGVTFVNADEIAKGLVGYPSTGTDLEAGRLVLERLDELESRRESFAVETTLASRSLAPRIARMRCSGYLFRLIYLWSPHEEFSVQRVAARVRLGGHDIPEETIRRRYRAGLRNSFGLYLPLADFWEVHDNLTEAGPRLIAQGQVDKAPSVRDAAAWAAMRERAGDV
jgi:predicted ABC-type ATPase